MVPRHRTAAAAAAGSPDTSLNSLDILSEIASKHAAVPPHALPNSLEERALKSFLSNLTSTQTHHPSEEPAAAHDVLSSLHSNVADDEDGRPDLSTSSSQLAADQQVALLGDIDDKADRSLRANAFYAEQIKAMMGHVAAALERGEEMETLASHYAGRDSDLDAAAFTGIAGAIVNAPDLFTVVLPWFKWRFGVDMPVFPDGSFRDRYNNILYQQVWQTSERKKLEEVVLNQCRTLAAAETAKQGRQIQASSVCDDEALQFIEYVDWDWVSSVLPNRTPIESKIQYIQRQSPLVNRDKWSEKERERLHFIATQRKERDWMAIAKELGTHRTAAECVRQYRTLTFEKREWTSEEDQVLREAVALHGQNWQAVAQMVGRTSNQCINRWSKSVKPDIRRGKWLPSEDEALRNAVAAVGPVWRAVAPRVPGRTDAQCRERWCNILDPRIIVGNWTREEDDEIVKLRAEGKSWSQISKSFDGKRTDNHIMRRHGELTNPKKGKKATAGTGSRARINRGRSAITNATDACGPVEEADEDAPQPSTTKRRRRGSDVPAAAARSSRDKAARPRRSAAERVSYTGQDGEGSNDDVLEDGLMSLVA